MKTFFRNDERLGNAILFFFRELLREDERLAKTQAALQQEGLCLGMRQIQETIEHFKAQQEISSFLVNPEQLQHLEQVQNSWEKRETELLHFQKNLKSSTNDILALVKEVKDEQIWEEACEKDTKPDYENYLNDNTPHKHANKAKKRIQTIEDTKERLGLQKLFSLNPLDYLRLLWWILVMLNNSCYAPRFLSLVAPERG